MAKGIYIRSIETRKKLSESHKGKKMPESTRTKLLVSRIGKKNSEYQKSMVSKANKGKIGFSPSLETRKKNSESNKGKHNFSEDSRKKLRLSMINHIETTRGKLASNIGKQEKQILDNIESSEGVKILRQYPVDGYFIDGYDKENNIVYEIDETYHAKQPERDFRRQQYIEEKLNCQFVRINVIGD